MAPKLELELELKLELDGIGIRIDDKFKMKQRIKLAHIAEQNKFEIMLEINKSRSIVLCITIMNQELKMWRNI